MIALLRIDDVIIPPAIQGILSTKTGLQLGLGTTFTDPTSTTYRNASDPTKYCFLCGEESRLRFFVPQSSIGHPKYIPLIGKRQVLRRCL